MDENRSLAEDRVPLLSTPMRGRVLIRELEQGVGDGGRLGLHVSGGISVGLGLVRWVLDVQDGAGLGLHPVLQVPEKKRTRGGFRKESSRSAQRVRRMPWRGEGKKERKRERERGDSLDDGHDEHAAHGEDHWPLLVGLVPLGVFKVLVRQERERERGEKESQSGSPLGEGG